MKQSDISRITQAEKQGYVFSYWRDFDYSRLGCISYIFRAGSKKRERYNDCIIMADTETSKKDPAIIYQNHVVAWTISIRAYSINICTLWGHRPDTMIECIDKLHNSMPGDKTIIYFHNLPYDYVFLRQFMYAAWGLPYQQLNVKPHYPLFVRFENGLDFRDSLIIAQRSLDKWAKDLQVDHLKAAGKWNYDKIRNQGEDFTPDELEYIEHDTLAGVECLDKLRYALKNHTYSLPYTATGIPREECRKRGKKNRARDQFTRLAPEYYQQLILEEVFHGGYTHANRHYINRTINKEDGGIIKCYDFASSYPYCMIAEKFPMEKFHKIKARMPEQILKMKDKYAFIFKLIMVKPKLKDDFLPMPALQFSKCIKTVNAITDNGRILCAGYLEIWITEQDLDVIYSQYEAELMACVEVECAAKDYLPKWFRDYVFELFEQKTMLKGGDPVLYQLAKAKLNSLYGMCVQAPCKPKINEDYKTGEFPPPEPTNEDDYKEYLENKNSILPYQWGVWVTAYAFRHLFMLGDCIDGIWLYSDTDSCYAIGWNEDKVKAYNDSCKEKIKSSGYGSVLYEGREYWLGVAESKKGEDEYSEFRTVGSKRYVGRCLLDGKLHMTVAGVPKKKGVLCLDEDIENFQPGFIFRGAATGKKTHTYFFNDSYEDDQGNLTGDSIDLSDCDYLLDSVNNVDWQAIFYEEIEIQTYGEEYT